jgi:Flp pilus assembly protein TadD
MLHRQTNFSQAVGDARSASYDRLGRFDLAERAYQSAIHLVGETTVILNNRGYSYMLRGNLVAAARTFSRPWNENLAIRPSSTTLNFSTEVSGL